MNKGKSKKKMNSYLKMVLLCWLVVLLEEFLALLHHTLGRIL